MGPVLDSVSVPASAEVLAEAGRRVADRYPDLYAHQRTGVAFLLSRRRVILADDMGLGKTRQAIVAAREAAPDGPFLVVCPAGVKLVWEREIRAIEADADVRIVSGSDAPAEGNRWTVVNYDILGKHEAALGETAWAGLIIDEAHYIKNGSRRATHVMRLAGIEPGAGITQDPAAVYLLTGTPMTNRPRDLFNLLRAVRHPLAKSFYTYARRYCAAVNNGYGLDTRGASNIDELASIVAGVMLRRTKDEALDLPPKTRSWQPIEIASAAVRRDEARALDFYAKHGERDGRTWGTFLGLLGHARHTLAIAKVPATLEAVRERVDAGEKVVVFTSFTAVVDELAAAFGAQAVRITGETPAAQRLAAADRLQTDPSVRVLIGNLQAAGVGLTLTAATHVVFNDLDWVPANHWQGEDRIYRIGQVRPAFVTYLLAAGTLDDSVAALLEEKARLVGVLDAEAVHRSSLVDEVVSAAATGLRPDWTKLGISQATAVAVASDRSTMGLLDDFLDPLARSGRGLGAVTEDKAVFEFPGTSRPGTVNIVEIVAGVATCTCTGFGYRGNCSHAREAASRVA